MVEFETERELLYYEEATCQDINPPSPTPQGRPADSPAYFRVFWPFDGLHIIVLKKGSRFSQARGSRNYLDLTITSFVTYMYLVFELKRCFQSYKRPGPARPHSPMRRLGVPASCEEYFSEA